MTAAVDALRREPEDAVAALRRTLPGRLAHLAEKHPDSVALREKRLGIWHELTWREYNEAVEATGRMLWYLGVRPGDATAILSNNRTEWLYADLGAQGIGAQSVGVYETNPPADVAYVLNHSGAKVLFCEDQEQVDKVIEIAGETPSLRHVVVFDPRGTRSYEDDRLRSWRSFLRQGRELLKREPGWFRQRLDALDPDAPCMVVYTSGTTGKPKGALLSSTNVTAGGDATASLLGVSEEDTLLSYLPLCHVAEKIFTLFMPLTRGCVVHFGEALETVQADLREVSPTVFLGVPRIWEKIHAGVNIRLRNASWLKRKLWRFWVRRGEAISQRRLRGKPRSTDRLWYFFGDLMAFRPLQERLGLRRCRLPISGAAPISAELLKWFHAVGVRVLEGYGMTECGGASHINPGEATRLGTVGRPLPLVSCRTDAQGEILVAGPNVFAGYLHDAAATKETVDEEGWLHTGDIGEIDDDGYLRITGRKKEIIITSGGKNISPERIENALKMSPYIKEAVAIGDGRKFIAALIQVEMETAGDWASRRRIPYTSYPDLVSRPEIRKLVAKEIDRLNESFLSQVERVKSFRILPKELHQDDGELTATQKVRRSAVCGAFGQLIEEMYVPGKVGR